MVPKFHAPLGVGVGEITTQEICGFENWNTRTITHKWLVISRGGWQISSGHSSRVATSPDLDLAFGAVDVNVDRACTSLLSPLSHLPPPTSSPPSSVLDGTSRFIRFVTPMRHLHPCELAPLDALLGGGFPCCALSPLFPVTLSGLPMHIDYDSLGCSSRRPAIAFT